MTNDRDALPEIDAMVCICTGLAGCGLNDCPLHDARKRGAALSQENDADVLEQRLWSVIDADTIEPLPSDIVAAVSGLKAQRDAAQAALFQQGMVDDQMVDRFMEGMRKGNNVFVSEPDHVPGTEDIANELKAVFAPSHPQERIAGSGRDAVDFSKCTMGMGCAEVSRCYVLSQKQSKRCVLASPPTQEHIANSGYGAVLAVFHAVWPYAKDNPEKCSEGYSKAAFDHIQFWLDQLPTADVPQAQVTEDLAEKITQAVRQTSNRLGNPTHGYHCGWLSGREDALQAVLRAIASHSAGDQKP